VKIAEAYGHKGIRVTQRSEVAEAIREAQEDPGTVVIDFRVEKEDSVYPMVPAGADLHAMIRRPMPAQNVMVESGSDDEWDISVK
jgi:acetolactate synthase-1/2/3 large subunit